MKLVDSKFIPEDGIYRMTIDVDPDYVNDVIVPSGLMGCSVIGGRFLDLYDQSVNKLDDWKGLSPKEMDDIKQKCWIPHTNGKILGFDVEKCIKLTEEALKDKNG